MCECVCVCEGGFRGSFSLLNSKDLNMAIHCFSTVALGGKLLWAFPWDMSGIDVIANTDIGRHMSTLVCTMTTIRTDFEAKTERMKKVKSGTDLPTMKPQPLISTWRTKSFPRAGYHHQRTMSLLVGRPPAVEKEYKEVLEQDLARQARKLQKLR